MEESGKLRTVYIPRGLDEKVEDVRKQLSWSRSYLYKYALTSLLERLSVLSSSVHKEAAR